MQTIEIQQLPLWDKLRQKRVPVSFDIEITARCNLNCRHCYINQPAEDRQVRQRELSVSEILDIGRQAVDLGAIWCLITGGEPLLRDDFADIYLGLKRLGLLVSVFSNATLITRAHRDLFRKFPPRDIEVSVYGVTRETFEAVTRQPGSFKHFMHGIDELERGGVRVRLKTMAVRSNFHEQRGIADFCRKTTKDYFRFDPQLHLRIDGDQYRNQEIRAERLTAEQIVALEESDTQRFSALVKECGTLIDERFTRAVDDHLFLCGVGNNSFTVGYDGWFRLCSSLCAKETMFDLKKGTLAEAWHDFVPRVRGLRSQDKVFLNTCRRCALVNICMWCPAHAHLETGELTGAVPYFCDVAHRRAASITRSGSMKE